MTREIKPGTCVRATKDNGAIGLIKGKVYRVISIGHRNYRVEDLTGREIPGYFSVEPDREDSHFEYL
jgi:hypothetical protein